MSVQLRKFIVAKRHPKIGLNTFNVENFAKMMSSVPLTREVRIGQIQYVKKEFEKLLKITEPESSVSCQLSAMYSKFEELRECPIADPLDLSTLDNDNETGSEGDSNDHIDERTIPENLKNSVSRALKADIERLFMSAALSVEVKTEYALRIAAFLNIFQRKAMKWIS